MPSRYLAPVLILLSASGFAAALDKKDKTPKIEPFASADGRFAVKVGGKESLDTKQLSYGPNPEQTVARTITKWDAPPPGGTYSITYADYPEHFKGVDAKFLLDGARDGVRGPEGLGGTVQADKACEVAGPDDKKVAGREVVVKARKNWVRVRLVLVELRLYEVMVTGTEEVVNGDAAKQFLDSFQLTK